MVKFGVGQTGCYVDPLERKLRDCQMMLEKSINILRSPAMVNRELIADDLATVQDIIEEAVNSYHALKGRTYF